MGFIFKRLTRGVESGLNISEMASEEQVADLTHSPCKGLRPLKEFRTSKENCAAGPKVEEFALVIVGAGLAALCLAQRLPAALLQVRRLDGSTMPSIRRSRRFPRQPDHLFAVCIQC